MQKTANTVAYIGAFVVAAALVSACSPPKHASDYREGHALVVGTETLTLKMLAPIPENGLPGAEQSRVKRFTGEYVTRGKGPVTAKLGGSALALAVQETRLREILVLAGVHPNDTRILRTGKPGEILLSFDASSVKVPECGDYSSKESMNWTNRIHSNFGCAYQRNIGLNVADPADLVKAKPMSGSNAVRANRVFQGNRDGTGGAAAGAGAAAN